MEDFANLLQKVYTQADVPEADKQSIENNLKSNWYDSPAVIGSSRISDLTKISIPEVFATQLIEEAKAVTEVNSKATYSYSTGKSYSRKNWGNATPRINYNIKDDLDSKTSGKDTWVTPTDIASLSKEDQYKKYFETFIQNEPNLDLRDRSLKKLKFILVKINNSPDIKEFRQLDPDNPEIHKLILSYESLSNVIRVLGFESVKGGKMELKSSKLNIELIQECVNYISKLRKNEKEVEFGPTPGSGPMPTIIEGQDEVLNKWNDQLQSGHELIKASYSELILPKVAVINSAEKFLQVLENHKNMLNQMETTRNSLLASIEEKKNGQSLEFMFSDLNLKEEDSPFEIKRKELAKKSARISAELKNIKKALDSVQNLIDRLLDKNSETFKPLNFASNNMVEKRDSYCKSELMSMLGTATFQENPTHPMDKMNEMMQLEKEFDNIRKEIERDVPDFSLLGNVFKELNAYANDQRMGFLISYKNTPVLYLAMYQGEIFTTLFDIVGMKLGLESDEFQLWKDDGEIEVGINKLLPVGDEFEEYFAKLTLTEKKKEKSVKIDSSSNISGKNFLTDDFL